MTGRESWGTWGRKWNDLLLAVLFAGLGIGTLVLRNNDIDKINECTAQYREALVQRADIVEDRQAAYDQMLFSITGVLISDPLPANWQVQVGMAFKEYGTARIAMQREPIPEPPQC